MKRIFPNALAQLRSRLKTSRSRREAEEIRSLRGVNEEFLTTSNAEIGVFRRLLTHKQESAQPSPLPHVAWHQWSVVRMAWYAMAIVLTGYLIAAILAVRNIDQLLSIVHDSEVESTLKSGLESQKDAYKAHQELLIHGLKKKGILTERITKTELERALKGLSANTILSEGSWSVSDRTEQSKDCDIQWLSRSELCIGPFLIKFEDTAAEEKYRNGEQVLQRYQVIGLELRERIRPALIKALSITLAIMCSLLLIAFIYMALRAKTRVEHLIKGFLQYAEEDQNFRFSHHWNSELGLISRQFNNMANEVQSNRNHALGLEKLASWQTIARKMAHEIKNPLTPIQIMIAQLKRHYDGQNKDFLNLLTKAHDVILEEVSSLRRMVDDFSQFAQLPSPRFENRDAVLAVKQTIALVEGSYAPHPIRYEGPSHHLHCDFDDQLIRLALHNLIKNAAEADPGKPSTIHIRIKDDLTHLYFEVEDHGPGIPEHLLKNIFEAYVTTKHTGPSPGMGLGLAICQKIALEHGGKISVTSQPGQTIFQLIIPKRRRAIRL